MFHRRLPAEQTGFNIQTEISSMLSLLFTASCKYTLMSPSSGTVLQSGTDALFAIIQWPFPKLQVNVGFSYQVLNRIFLEDHLQSETRMEVWLVLTDSFLSFHMLDFRPDSEILQPSSSQVQSLCI